MYGNAAACAAKLRLRQRFNNDWGCSWPRVNAAGDSVDYKAVHVAGEVVQVVAVCACGDSYITPHHCVSLLHAWCYSSFCSCDETVQAVLQIAQYLRKKPHFQYTKAMYYLGDGQHR
jgi:hypothetical protein